MYQGCKKYIPFIPVSLPDRTWPNNRIEKAPTWCSVDLRDGNQALVTPMNLQEKLDFFKLLVRYRLQGDRGRLSLRLRNGI